MGKVVEVISTQKVMKGWFDVGPFYSWYQAGIPEYWEVRPMPNSAVCKSGDQHWGAYDPRIAPDYLANDFGCGHGVTIEVIQNKRVTCGPNDCKLDCPDDPDGFCCISLDVIENAAKRINAPSPGGVTV
jgi:hypothetical protein